MQTFYVKTETRSCKYALYFNVCTYKVFFFNKSICPCMYANDLLRVFMYIVRSSNFRHIFWKRTLKELTFDSFSTKPNENYQ